MLLDGSQRFIQIGNNLVKIDSMPQPSTYTKLTIELQYAQFAIPVERKSRPYVVVSQP
jgi:hypothetical protein